MSVVSCGVNYETMYRKVAERIMDKNTIISVLKTENQMMNDAFQAKIEEMKEQIIQLGVERKMTEDQMTSKIDRLEKDMSRLGNKPKVKAYTCKLNTCCGKYLLVVVEPTDTIFDVRVKIREGLVRYSKMFRPVEGVSQRERESGNLASNWYWYYCERDDPMSSDLAASKLAAAKSLDAESRRLSGNCFIHMGNGVWMLPQTDFVDDEEDDEDDEWITDNGTDDD